MKKETAEKIYKFLAISLAVVLVFCLLRSCTIISNAAISENQKVVSHTATWEGYPFTFTLGGKYYTVQDASGIPTSTYQNPNFFYTHDNVKFDIISGIDIYTYILNNNLGIVLKDTLLQTIYNSFTTLINVLDINEEYLQGGLYDGNGNFLGYCLNDISGCYFAQNSTDGIDFNQDLPNNIYYHYHYYLEQNPEYPTFFTFKTISNSGIVSNTGAWNQTQIDFFNTSMSNNLPCWCFGYTSGYPYTTYHYGPSCPTGSYCWIELPEDCIYYFTYESAWNNFCKLYGLTLDNTELTYTQMIAKHGVQVVNSPVQAVGKTSGTQYLLNDQNIKLYNNNNQTVSTANYSQYIQLYIGCNNQFFSSTGYTFTMMPFNGEFTFFKNATAKYNIDNQLYYPNSYITDSYNNYDSNNTNSYNTTKTVVDNSVQNNGDAYTDCNNDFYNYYDNGYYDSSSQITNNTTIINNYYDDGGGDNSDNPDNPDNPDNNETLDAILRAILRFFNAIGDIIGTLLAGVINLIDAVLESLAGVMENLDGMSDLFASLFAWIPEPVPQILGAGFGICLVCGLIKFIRG